MKNKHFEDVWIEAEKISSDWYGEKQNNHQLMYDLYHLCNELLSYMSELMNGEAVGEESINESFSKVLFALTYMSNYFNINVWVLLEQLIKDKKLIMLDPDVKSILEDSKPGE